MNDLIARLEDALRSPNARAWLEVIAACEGTAPKPDGYRALYGWRPGRADRLFASFDDHPRVKFWPNGSLVQPGEAIAPYSYTTASGRYQATETTWERFIRDVGPRDFSPHSQDLFALWCTDKDDALDDVLAGRLEDALKKTSGTWASFPFATNAQPHRTLSFCMVVFSRALDAVVEEDRPEQPADVPQETPAIPVPEVAIPQAPGELTTEKPMPLMLLLQSLLSIFTPLAQAKLTQALNKTTKDPVLANTMATQIIGVAQQATGLADPVEAVAAVKADARKSAQAVTLTADGAVAGALAAKVEADTLAYLDQIAPLLDKAHSMQKDEWAAEESSRDAAARRAAEGDNGQDGVLTWAIVVMVGALMIGLASAIAILAYQGKAYGEVLALFSTVAGAVVAKFGTRYDYRYGSSRQSVAKDITLSQIATKK